MTSAQRTIFSITGLFFCSLLIFTWGLGSQEIIGFDSRFYLFAQEMLRNGFSWFPTTYHQPYPDYTGASTWMICVCAKLFGGLDKFTAVLPSAVLASVTLLLTYQIGALRDRLWGWLAVCLLVMTVTFLKSARSISLDMYPVAISAGCFYLLYSAAVKQDARRVIWIYPLLFLGFVFRGPIGLVIPAGVVAAFYLANGRFRQFFWSGAAAFLLLVSGIAALLLLAWHAGGKPFLQDVLRMQMLGRMDNHFHPRYFYFTSGIRDYILAFPLSCLVMLGAAWQACKMKRQQFPLKKHFSSDGKLLLALFGWVMIILLGMSVPDDKKIRYIMPMIPAAALIAAYPFAVIQPGKYFAVLRWLTLRIFLLLPMILLLVLSMLCIHERQMLARVGVDYFYPAAALLLTQAAAVYFWRRQPGRGASAVFACAAASVVLANAMVVEPVELYYDQARHFVMQVETLRQRDHASLAFYRERPDSLPIKYLINMPRPELPAFIDNEQALLQYRQPAYFVASEEYFTGLDGAAAKQFVIIARNSLGHVPVVIFRRVQDGI